MEHKDESFFAGLGFDVWQAIVNGYKAPTSTPTNAAVKILSENNSKVINFILGVLTGSKFVKVMHCSSTKEI